MSYKLSIRICFSARGLSTRLILLAINEHLNLLFTCTNFTKSSLGGCICIELYTAAEIEELLQLAQVFKQTNNLPNKMDDGQKVPVMAAGAAIRGDFFLHQTVNSERRWIFSQRAARNFIFNVGVNGNWKLLILYIYIWYMYISSEYIQNNKLCFFQIEVFSLFQ